jgi:hypothetical protein
MSPTSPRSEDQQRRAALGNAALLWVNYVRVNVIGCPPIPALRRGYAGDPCRCPIAQSLGAGATVLDSAFVRVTPLLNSDRRTLTPPLAVQSFIQRFDRGEYPGLTLTR